MATKAEALAALQQVNIAAQAAAKVVSELPDSVPVTSTPQTADVVFTERGDGVLLVTARAGITRIRWVHASGEPPHHAWYGANQEMDIGPEGVALMPAYRQDGDFVLVQYGPNFAQTQRGPAGKRAAPVVTPVEPVVNNNTGPKAWARGLILGINQERKNFLHLRYDGRPMTERHAYDYYATLGINWQRYFIPMNFVDDRGIGKGMPSPASYEDILQAARAAMMAGQRVVLCPIDKMDTGDMPYKTSIYVHYERVCNRISELGFPPDRFVLENCNELCQHDNHYWNEFRIALHNIGRRVLPNHTIAHGAAQWNQWQMFNDTWEVPPDRNIILKFHHYEHRSDWGPIARHMTAFGNKLGVPVVNGEMGDNFQNMSQDKQGRWAQNYEAYARTAGLLSLCPWAMVGPQNDFRLNRGPTDARILPSLETSFKKCADIVRALPGFQS